tara:strand:- start:254 stop:1351 length:1098 start_codon:yes stop_codon:yes gene_type:complete
MSTIDEKFEKLIAEKKATEAVAEEASEPNTEVSEDAAVGKTAITSGAVPQQKSDLKNDAVEVASSNSKDKPEGDANVGKRAAAPVAVEKDKTLKMKPSGASSKMPGALSAKIFDDVEVEGEAVNEDSKEDISAVLAGADLSEEFQERAKTVFEAAVDARVAVKIDSLKEQAAEAFVAEIEEIKNEFAGRVENFLQYAADEWLKENELAVEQGLRTEVTETFMEGLRKLFIESNINVPDDKLDLAAEMSEKLDDMEDRLNEQVKKNVELHEVVGTYRKNEILIELTRGLAETQKDKFISLAEAVEFKSDESYREKLGQIKESYFGTPKTETVTEVASEESAPEAEKQLETVSESMQQYVQQLAKRI